MRVFETSQALADWLQNHQIDTTQWGQGTAKSVEDLWREVQNSESVLYNEPPLRRVRVVEVVVRRGNQQLIEAAQMLVTGQMRHRNQPPSEKMHPGEDPLAAAQRCLVEELGIDPAVTASFLPQMIGERQEIIESSSYPGLFTEFTFYRVAIQARDLPTTDFSTTNIAHAHGDPVVAHHWRWKPCSL